MMHRLPSMILPIRMNTSFVHDGEVFIVFRGGTSDMSPGTSDVVGFRRQRRVIQSAEHAALRQRRLLLGCRSLTTAGSSSIPTTLISRKTTQRRTEHSLRDQQGWRPDVVGCADRALCQGDSHMQLSGKLGGLYFMHGRSGSNSGFWSATIRGRANFVLYSSPDGIHWMRGLC